MAETVAKVSETIDIVCPHCAQVIKTNQLTRDDCDECGNSFLNIELKKCKNPECTNIYCLTDCADSKLNERGYCDDCAKLTCDGCGDEELERDDEKRCTKCGKTEYCPECALQMLDILGLCINCTAEEVIECEDRDCSKKILKNKAHLCKNFARCETAFCEEHKGDLDEDGFCDDCNQFTCLGCNSEFDINEAVHCSNPECVKKSSFCKDCASRLVTTSGLCASCANEKTYECVHCQNTFLESRLIGCKNVKSCGNWLCEEGKEQLLNGLCHACRTAECSGCGKRLELSVLARCTSTTCTQANIYCATCAPSYLDKRSYCVSCTSEPTVSCVTCEKKVLEATVKTCDNCKRAYCRNCVTNFLTCFKCEKKVCPSCGTRCRTCEKPFCYSCTGFDKNRYCPDHQDKEARPIQRQEKTLWQKMFDWS